MFERENERDRENGCLKSCVFISHSFEGYAAEVPHLHEGEARGSEETEFSFLSILLSHTLSYFQLMSLSHSPSLSFPSFSVHFFIYRLLYLSSAAGLPPFFAIITSPSLMTPYRMESLKVTLGRNTRAQKFSGKSTFELKRNMISHTRKHTHTHARTFQMYIFLVRRESHTSTSPFRFFSTRSLTHSLLFIASRSY